MKNIIVLGAGNMGTYIASNLAEDNKVTIADYNKESLGNITREGITKKQEDLSDPDTIASLVSDFDYVVSALPEIFGYEAITAIIKAGKYVVDISFWEQSEERLQELDNLAKEKKVIAFIDCGIAPGFSNATVSSFDNLLDGKTKKVHIYVGGISQDRERGFFAPWSIAGLIEEYQREALRVWNGRAEKVKALSITEDIEFQDVGTLEAAITDGLRSIAFTMSHIPNMAEFTLRYPGHFDQMKSLQTVGYFNDEKVDVGQERISAQELSQMLLQKVSGERHEKVLRELSFYDTEQYTCVDKKISPRHIAALVLSKTWKMQPEDKDMLVMRIQADDGIYQNMADIYAEHNGTDSAMALCTGGMAALATRAIMTSPFHTKGAFPLEEAIKVQPELMGYFINGLEKLGVRYTRHQNRSNV